MDDWTVMQDIWKGYWNVTKRWISLLVVIVVACGILFLTFQGPTETKELTQRAQGALEQIGIHVEEKPLRHYIHYVLYLLLGLAICVLCLTKEWNLKTGALIACGIGVVDEGIKVFLPTREFDITDLFRDFIGVAVAVGIAMLIRRVKAVK